MNNPAKKKITPYLSALGAWAFAFGCSVGWGAFVMPGNTFLPIAGPVGSAIGLGLGALIMLIIAANYHFLMNRFPDEAQLWIRSWIPQRLVSDPDLHRHHLGQRHGSASHRADAAGERVPGRIPL